VAKCWTLSGHFCKLATFVLIFTFFGRVKIDEKSAKNDQLAKYLAKLATFKINVSSKKPSIYAGLRAFWPDGHFYLPKVFKIKIF